MNAPLPEHLRTCGLSPRDFPVLEPRTCVKRRVILARSDTGDIQSARERLDGFLRYFNLRNHGRSLLVFDPDRMEYPILAWSIIHGDQLISTEKRMVLGRVFETAVTLRAWQAKHWDELRWLQQTVVLACEIEQSHLSAHLVDWRTLLLVRQG